MKIRTLTKTEVEEVYKTMEQKITELTGTEGEEAEHIEGILIIGFRDDNTFSSTNIGQIKFRNLVEAFDRIIALHYTEILEEKQKHAE